MNSREEIKSSITIAVLPFQVISDESIMVNLFAGFTEDLITNFSKFIGLSVISSFSTNQIKDISDPTETDKLSADYLIRGKVIQIGEVLRISVQLLKSQDKSIVFGEQYKETRESLIEAQDIIVQQIVNVLHEKINFNILSHSYKKKGIKPAAYEHYLIGMNTLTKGTREADLAARSNFESALEIDPNFSLAYSGISMSYFNFWSCLLWDRWDESMKGAMKYALKAVESDPDDYLALGILGRTYVYQGAYEQAEYCLRKSLLMNANDAANLLRVSFSLMYLGYADEAVRLYLKAIKINPFHTEKYFAYGSNYYLQIGDFEKSIELSKKVPLSCWNDFPAWVAAAYLQTGDFDNLWKCWEVFLEQFKKTAYTGKEDLETEALDWLLILNPFKGQNYLTPLCDFIRSQKNMPIPSLREKGSLSCASFLLKANLWEISYHDKTLFFADAKGYHDIQKLLSAPFREFHCTEMMGSTVYESKTVESVDAKAKAQYLKRLKELKAEIDETYEMNLSGNTAALRKEYDEIVDHLSKSLGLGGKSRKVGSGVEKARSALTWRIRNAIKKIKESHPELGNHLSNSVKTGTYCSYKPEIKVDWEL